jgi:hypothetical protein
MRWGRPWVLGIGAVLVLVLPTEAVSQVEPRVRTSVDTTLVAVGDRITLTVEVEHPFGSVVQWPDSLSLEPFEVLSAEVDPPSAQGDGIQTRLRLSLTAFELGDLEIPRFELAVIGADSTVTRLETDAYGVRVASVGLDEGGGIRSLLGPLSIARDWLRLTLWMLLIAVVAATLIRWWRRRTPEREGRERGPVRIQRPAHELALEALDALARSKLLERGEIKAFYVEVSEIIRTYVEGRYAVYALEMTSGEVLDGLWRVGIEGSLLENFRTFLEQCDLVKFAKLRPTPEASRGVLESARTLVEETQPRVIEVRGEDFGDLGEVEREPVGVATEVED